MFKKEIRKIVGGRVKIISQDEIIHKKLKEYLGRHPEITNKLSKNKSVKIIVTDKTQNLEFLVKKWFGKTL
jgi:glutamate racemase